MLIWTNDLRQLGFRKKAERYWRCDKGYGLDNSTHISLFLWTIQEQISRELACFDVAEFHVTFEVPGHNLHFYYHETIDNQWTTAGHTSNSEVSLLGWDLQELCETADEIARQFVQSINGVFHDR